jgi:hypothetical protein
MNTLSIEHIELTDVAYQGDHKIKVSFNNGITHTVDFEPFLLKAKHPEIKKYLDLNKFQNFTFNYGHLHWNDYDLSFSNDDLYTGCIT